MTRVGAAGGDLLRAFEMDGEAYDGTRRGDPYIAERLAHHLAIEPSGTYLDLGCGTGNYTTLLSRRGGRWYGIDASESMLARARSKSDDVEWRRADAGALPFPDRAFDGAVSSLATHYLASLPQAFGEMRRVLSGGRFVIFTATPEQTRRYWLTEYFPVAMERSAEVMTPLPELERTLAGAGLIVVGTERYDVRADLEDLFLYSGKHAPERYLDPGFRQGIGTFRNFAHPDEVRIGCDRLRRDIASGRISEIIHFYAHDDGDYLVVIAEPGP